jgi:hypothetical protein
MFTHAMHQKYCSQAFGSGIPALCKQFLSIARFPGINSVRNNKMFMQVLALQHIHV